jgi:ribonuclease HI
VQSISRAELSGALAALKWVASYRTVACLWSDSKTTVDGLQALLAGRWNPHDAACENHDLWQQIAHLLEDLPEGSFMAFWIPSHLDVVQCASAWEEWIALWNAAADQLVVQANIARSDDFMQLKTNVSKHHELWSSRLRLLRRFYFMVAEQKEQAAEVIDLTASESFDWPSLGVDLALSDVIPVNWKSLLSSPHVQMKYPHEFVFMLFEAVFSFEQHAEILAPISYVEIALWCIGDGGISFPFWNPSLSDWELRPYHSLLLKPTIASVVQVVRLVLRKGLQTMGLEQYLLKGIRKHEAGLLLPVDGIGLCTNFATANSLASCCLQAAGQRRFRKAADLARPL